MKKRLFLVLILISLMFSLSAEEVLIVDKKFFPEKFHVGDSVSLTLEILSREGEELTLPENIESSESLVLDDISLSRLPDSIKITMIFRSFQPGSGYTPEITLGDKSLPPVPFYTTPVLSPEDKNLFPVRDQALFPGAKLYTSLFILILIVSPILALFLIRYSIKYSVIIIKNYLRRRPYRKFSKLVKKLDGSLVRMEQKDFYSELTDGLKEYLSSRVNKDLTSLTTGEIARLKLGLLEQQHKNELVSWFRKSDLIKFAGGTSSMEERRSSLETLSNVCTQVETGNKKQEDKNAEL